MKGTSHDKLGFSTAIVIACSSFYYGLPLYTYLALCSGVIMGTIWLSPDLDLYHSLPSKRWGPLKFIWKTYASQMKHRGLSHRFIIGTLHRIWYLLCRFFRIPLLILVVINLQYPNLFVYFLMWVVGVEIYCISHITSDNIYSFLKSQGVIK